MCRIKPSLLSALPGKMPVSLILLVLILFDANAQAQFANPLHITSREGLPDNRVHCIEQDGDGFMWFGTADGLCRFDGSVIKVFRNEPGGLHALSSSGNTSVKVIHGLDIPGGSNFDVSLYLLKIRVSVTPLSNIGNARRFWASDIGAAIFKINVDADPEKEARFAWRAEVI